VPRPFAGRPDEPDLVALRELVPSASAPLTLSAEHLAAHPEHADRSIVLGTILPQAAPALVRDDAVVLVAVQTVVSGLDPSVDIAAALLAALDAEPGTVVDDPPASGLLEIDRRPEGLAGLPRLHDILDPAPIDVTVHRGFEWWLPASVAGSSKPADGSRSVTEGDEDEAAAGEDGSARRGEHPDVPSEPDAPRGRHDSPAGTPVTTNPEVTAALERANASIVPTVRLSSVEAAYWCNPGERWHLRWVLPHPEEELLDAFARIAAAGELTVGDGSRYAGAFRVGGLLVPVWDLAPGTEAETCEEPLVALRAELDRALADPHPLTPAERRVRAGVVARSLTLR
jgi:hypothetical protein